MYVIPAVVLLCASHQMRQEEGFPVQEDARPDRLPGHVEPGVGLHGITGGSGWLDEGEEAFHIPGRGPRVGVARPGVPAL